MSSIEEKNHYELLGVEQDASEDQIRASYKELVRIFHPDSNFFSEIVSERVDDGEADAFKRITDAYKVLTDAKKREEYDKTLSTVLKDWASEDPRVTPGASKAWSGNDSSNAMDKAVRKSTFGVRQGVSPQREREIQSVMSVREMMNQRKSFWTRVLELFSF